MFISLYMKNVTLIIALFVMLMQSNASLQAQSPVRKNHKTSLFSQEFKLRKNHDKEVRLQEIVRIKFEIVENENKFKTLMRLESPDINELYQNIDELQALHIKLSHDRFKLLLIALNIN